MQCLEEISISENVQPGNASTSNDHRLAILQEMQVCNFDLIRFASYRTACKLRFIQKKVNLHAVDIWNVIEAFREHALNTLEPNCELSVARLETLLCSLFHNLNKRLPQSQQVHVDQCSALLLNWLLSAYSTVDNVGKIKVFSIKIALATMCAGKLMDKLRYIFSQISDGNGLLVAWKFSDYLQEVLALPAAVYESPSFNYSENLGAAIFPNLYCGQNTKVTVNDFMDTMMSDPGPPPLVWLPLLHRLASVENVIHTTTCDACHTDNFTGFRYRCQKCPHYNLCMECFWRGRVSGSHTNEHPVKEYTTYKSPSKQIGHSLRKSFRCVPEKSKNAIPRFPDQPEKPLNLSHIVPPSPLPSHNGFPDNSFGAYPFDVGSMDSRSTARRYSLDSSRIDDEHRLIARYAARLAQETRTMPRTGHRSSVGSPEVGRTSSEAALSLDTSRAQRELISQLESKNREIMREITRLRRQQELESGGNGSDNPNLVSELRALRQRKDELETHLSALQDSRRQLMVQLEGLMKMLKVQNHQSSPRSTPNSSPRSTKSPPLPPGMTSTPLQAPIPQMPPISQQQQQQHQQQQQQQQQMSMRGGPTQSVQQQIMGGGNNDRGGMMMGQRSMQDGMHRGGGGGMVQDPLIGVGGDVRSAFEDSAIGGSPNNNEASCTPGGRSLRNDLLVAADSVTNAMSTLVRELNSETGVSHQQHSNIRKPLDFEEDIDDEADTTGWQQELQRRYEQEASFMAELRARQLAGSPPPGGLMATAGLLDDTDSNGGDKNKKEINKEEKLGKINNSNTDSMKRKSKQEKDDRDLQTLEWEEAMKRWVNR